MQKAIYIDPKEVDGVGVVLIRRCLSGEKTGIQKQTLANAWVRRSVESIE